MPFGLKNTSSEFQKLDVEEAEIKVVL